MQVKERRGRKRDETSGQRATLSQLAHVDGYGPK